MVPLAAIFAIVVILVVAMLLGKNGIVLAGGVAAISGLGGYEIKALISKKKGE